MTEQGDSNEGKAAADRTIQIDALADVSLKDVEDVADDAASDADAGEAADDPAGEAHRASTATPPPLPRRRPRRSVHLLAAVVVVGMAVLGAALAQMLLGRMPEAAAPPAVQPAAADGAPAGAISTPRARRIDLGEEFVIAPSDTAAERARADAGRSAPTP